jgi:hypothetical protein
VVPHGHAKAFSRRSPPHRWQFGIVAAATETDGDTTIDLGGGDTVTLLNVEITDLHADDFLF